MCLSCCGYFYVWHPSDSSAAVAHGNRCRPAGSSPCSSCTLPLHRAVQPHSSPSTAASPASIEPQERTPAQPGWDFMDPTSYMCHLWVHLWFWRIFLILHSADDFESKFQFHPVEDLPPPDEFKPFPRIYPSKENRGSCTERSIFLTFHRDVFINLLRRFSSVFQWTPSHPGWGHTYDESRPHPGLHPPLPPTHISDS